MTVIVTVSNPVAPSLSVTVRRNIKSSGGGTSGAAVAAPRLHQQWNPSKTRFEEGFEPVLLEALAEVHGHEIEVVQGGIFASVQAIAVGPDGAVFGVSHPRRGGVAGLEGKPVPPTPRPDE